MSLKYNYIINFRGTPLYIAPELIQKENASSKVDIWSLGVILYRLMFCRFPFLDPNKKYDINSVFEDIVSNKLIIPKTSKRSQDLVDICFRMLNKDKDKRMSWEELFNHPFIKLEN